MSVAITGMGVVSALGIGVKNTYTQLIRHQTGITKQEGPILNGSTPRLVGRVPYSNAQLKKLLHLPHAQNIPRSGLIGALAAKEALGSTSFTSEIACGFINGGTVGGMDLSEEFYHEFVSTNSFEKAPVVASHDLGTVTHFIAQQCGQAAYINTISTACSSAANSIMLGARLIEAGILDRVVVGGADALTQFTINGFTSLMIYSDSLCQPFDQERSGLNLGEGAGYLLLESAKSLAISGNKPLARLSGWHNANDAFHQTGTSPNGHGAALAMQGALKKAQLHPAQIGYINAHGTATNTNDASEGAAIQEVFKNTATPLSSTKGFTGHTLGAAGGVEAVFSILALQNNEAFANLNTTQPTPETAAQLVMKTTAIKDLNHVMSNSFGFGGNSSTLIFSKS